MFDTIGHLCAALHVSRPTWQRIFDEESVKPGTATKLVMEFFALLSDVSEGVPLPAGVFRQFGLTLFKKYEGDIAALSFDAFVDEHRPPRPKEVPVTAVNEG